MESVEVPGQAELITPVGFVEEEIGDAGDVGAANCLVESFDPSSSNLVGVDIFGCW